MATFSYLTFNDWFSSLARMLKKILIRGSGIPARADASGSTSSSKILRGVPILNSDVWTHIIIPKLSPVDVFCLGQCSKWQINYFIIFSLLVIAMLIAFSYCQSNARLRHLIAGIDPWRKWVIRFFEEKHLIVISPDNIFPAGKDLVRQMLCNIRVKRLLISLFQWRKYCVNLYIGFICPSPKLVHIHPLKRNCTCAFCVDVNY